MSDVRALFFARYRDLVGEDELRLPLARPQAVADLVRDLRARGEPWSRLPAEPAVAVNREVARTDTLVRPGDEIAFLPPVAGG